MAAASMHLPSSAVLRLVPRGLRAKPGTSASGPRPVSQPELEGVARGPARSLHCSADFPSGPLALRVKAKLSGSAHALLARLTPAAFEVAYVLPPQKHRMNSQEAGRASKTRIWRNSTPPAAPLLLPQPSIMALQGSTAKGPSDSSRWPRGLRPNTASRTENLKDVPSASLAYPGAPIQL